MSKIGIKVAGTVAQAGQERAPPRQLELSEEDKSKDAFFVQIAETAEAMIARLASRSGDALSGVKEMVGAVRDIPVPDGVREERRIFLDHMAKSEDVRAALARFLGPKER